MDAYHALAVSYDRLTNDVNYRQTVEFYKEILKKEGCRPRTAVDLACGTGSVTLLLAQEGLQIIGVDLSPEMLCVAQQKAQQLQNPPLFVCQDLSKLHLPKGVDLAVCALDSLDYITDPDACAEAIRRVDDQVFLDEDDDVYCVWRGSFDEEENICSYGMDLFQRRGEVWERSFEEHQEYAYSEEQLRFFLKEAGFDHIRVYADRLFEAPRPGEQRIYFSARKGRRK